MTTKKFLRIQFILVLLLLIALIGNTFSWADRPALKGGGYMGSGGSEFEAISLETPEYNINGDSCTAQTYKGTYDAATGKITYDETPLTKTNGVLYSDTMTKGIVFYFKTVITNTAETATNTSLFVNGISHNNFSTSIILGVTAPITSHTYPPNTAFSLIPIISQYEVRPANNGTPGTASVEWCIFYNETSTDIATETFTITDVILANN